MRRFTAILLCLSLLLGLAACGGESSNTLAPGERPAPPDRAAQALTLLSGPSSGVTFPVGTALANYWAELGYRADAAATAGVTESLNGLLAGEGELALALSDVAAQAAGATGAYEGREPAADLQAVTALWPQVCQIVTTSDTGVVTFADLKGKRVNVGTRNSPAELNARALFEAHGLTYEDAEVDYLSYGEGIDQLRRGECDVVFVSSHLGNSTVKVVEPDKKLVLVPADEKALEKLVKQSPCYTAATIPAAAYGTEADVPAAAAVYLLLADKDLPDEVVYDLLESIYSPEGVAALESASAALKGELSLENGQRGLDAKGPLALHPGAVRFWKDNQ